MDFQTIVNNQMKARRADSMANSEQLILGELILKLEALPNKELEIVFDDVAYKPTGLGSWRGSYCELAINYEGSEECTDQPKASCIMDEFKDHSYKCKCGLRRYDTSLSQNLTVSEFLGKLNLVKGRVFQGYKGGDFTMSKMTPVWVANYGESSGFMQTDNFEHQGIVDVQVVDKKVILVTKLMKY